MDKKHILLLFVLLSLFTGNARAQAPAITLNEIRLITGTWKGTLTYLDYSTKKPYTMPADVSVSYLPKSNLLVFSNTYPNEPKANGADTVRISADGRMLDKEMLQSKTMLPDGNMEIVKEEGVDGNDNKPARIRNTYTLGKTVFIKKKEVKFDDQTEWINRHQYSYTKK